MARHRLTTSDACDTLVVLTGQINPPTIAPSYRDCTMSDGPHGGGPPCLPIVPTSPIAPTLARIIALGYFLLILQRGFEMWCNSAHRP
jgi:hypothetical protein